MDDVRALLGDIGFRLAAGAVGVGLTAGAIINPNAKQCDASAQQLFRKRFDQLTAPDKRAAEFHAGHGRWVRFFEQSVYPITRALPGANSPILNPYKDAEPAPAADEDD